MNARIALPLAAALMAAIAACAPALAGVSAPPSASEPAAGCAEPCFLLMTERSTPEQRDEARTVLMAEFARIGITAEVRPYDTSVIDIGRTPTFTGANVVGTLPATLPATVPATETSTRHIVLGAHFDTVPGSPGVDDNGSGVQILFAVARRLASMENRSATVHFVLFDQEEVGLVGARVNAERWRMGDVPLESMHNMDMVGWDSDGDGLIEFDSNSPELTQLYQEMAVGLPGSLPISLLITTYPNTDHQAYRERGFTVASISQEFEDGSENPAYHKPGDTAVQREYYEASLQLMVRVFERLVSQ